MYRVPHGRIIVRPDAPEEMRGGLHLGVAEERPWGVCALVAAEVPTKPVEVHVGDRVAYKEYAGHELPLLLPGAPSVSRCVHCNVRRDRDHPEVCPKKSDPSTGSFAPHEFVEGDPEPEKLLVLRLDDVILVEAR